MPLGFMRGKHSRLRDQLSAYLDDELSPPERFEVEHHLEACPECRAELEDLRTIASATSMLPEVPPLRTFAIGADAMTTAVMPRAERPLAATAATAGLAAGAAAPSRPSWYLLGWAAAGIAALALGAGIAHLVTQASGSSSKPSTPVTARTTPAAAVVTATPAPTP